MILFLAAALQAAAPAPAAIMKPATGKPATGKPAIVKGADPREARYDLCLRLAGSDPAAARAEAVRWGTSGGAWFARQCAGLAFAQEGNFTAAAAEFEAAAKMA